LETNEGITLTFFLNQKQTKKEKREGCAGEIATRSKNTHFALVKQKTRYFRTAAVENKAHNSTLGVA
jgi:hypothetical protein